MDALSWYHLLVAFYLLASPLALQNHLWYHDTCPDYPAERRAVIPHVL